MMRILRWILVIAWMGVIFYLSSIPAADIPSGPEIISVVIHYLEYIILTILLCWAINGGFKPSIHPGSMIAAFIVAVFYGITDELHQLYVPGRVTDMMDLLVDAVGALSAIILILLVRVVLSRFRKTVLAD